MDDAARPDRSVVPLLWVWVALVVYASLYPFAGWRVPVSVPVSDWLVLAWPRRWTTFDAVSNLLGYLPLGALGHVVVRQHGRRVASAFAVAVVGGALLSLSMEELQNFLPQRVPSRMDWALNALGTALGAAVAAAALTTGAAQRWRQVRERWLVERSGGAVALLLLWPVGLLFPPPLPLATGHIVAQVPQAIESLLAGTSWSAWFADGHGVQPPPAPLTGAEEVLAIALGLLAPCLVAFSVARRGWRRGALAAGAIALGFGATTLSTALNFGPEHAFSWRTAAVWPAFVLGATLAALLALLPRRAAAGVGLVALTALVALVARAPADPYYAQSLNEWAQGRFIRFHGVAQWVGWLWPFAAMVYLLVVLAARDRDGAT